MFMIYGIIIGLVCGVLPWGFGWHQERSFAVGLVLTIAGSIVTGLMINGLMANEIGNVRFAALLATVCVALMLSFGCNMAMHGRRRM